MNFKHILIPLLGLLALAGCKKSHSNRLTATPTTITFPSTGGTQIVHVEGAGSWTFSQKDEWLTVTPVEAGIQITAPMTPEERTATVTLIGEQNSVDITVKQAGGPGKITSNMSFKGSAKTTTIATGDVYLNADARFEVAPQADGSIRLLMHETKFAEAMPAMEMEVPGITQTVTVDGVSLGALSATPEIAGTPYSRYQITGLVGSVIDTKLYVGFTCAGAYLVEYTGYLE